MPSQSIRIAVTLLAALALGACQPGWVRLDGSALSPDELRQARIACQVEEKRAQVDAAARDNTVQEAAVNDNQARMLRLEDRDRQQRRVASEIEACMREQGLRPGG